MPELLGGFPEDGSLTPERFAQVRAIFEAALERPPAERRAYADGACAGDEALVREVEAMLAADEETRPYLDLVLPGPTATSSSSTHEEGRFPAGTVLAGRYRILGLLGRGGMGEVHKAFDLILNQVVALKFLLPRHLSEAALVRFRNEVRIARQVSHPNVARVYDLGMVEGLHFLSMEFIDGEDLASLLRRIGRLPQDKATEFTRKICAGLGAAHERGVLHRDLKPANIMIDGRGQPRITDFGLAGLAAEIPLSDLRSGTPAYMSPEQKEGKEVTVRSDLYSLGLVLHEMFTGKPRKGGTQTNPSEFVKDLDPAIERLILRCLDEDPKRRPSSAFSVAMALPGADPIAAALAAGETPSPEMVAASQEKEGFSPRTAVLCFLGILVAFGIGAAFQSYTSLPARAPMPLPPDANAQRVREILQHVGYSADLEASVYGYVSINKGAVDYITSLKGKAQDIALQTHRPAIATFLFRHTSTPKDPSSKDLPFTGEKPQDVIQVWADPLGRLLRLEADLASRLTLLREPPPWDTLFHDAGLNFERFRCVEPDSNPTIGAEQRVAWEGSWEGRPERIRVEAGLLMGHVTYFSVQSPVPFQPFPFTPVWVLLPVAGLLIVGWQNLRHGRTDRRGSRLIAVAALIFALVARLLMPESPGIPEDAFLIASVFVLSSWLAYVAAEPYMRRYWPDSLISWSRLCSGGARNALVASHVLLGILAAEVWSVALCPCVVFYLDYGGVGGTGKQALMFLQGPAPVLSGVAWFSLEGLLRALLCVVVVTLGRLLLRKAWLADPIAGALIALTTASYGEPLLSYAFVMLGWLCFLWMLRRFGFLTFLTIWVIHVPILYFPVVLTGWMASRVLVVHAIPITIACWALWVILTDKRSGWGMENVS